ncbi:MAG TPA: hypothetical protein PK445_10885 [Methanolinea sp.]|nr:hypothetical protein [Methanolinea sp.]
MQIQITGMVIALLLCSVLISPALADEGFWKSRSIDAERDELGSYCSLKIDANDRAYIAYYSDTSKCLKLAWQPGIRGAGDIPFFAWSPLTKSGSTTGKGVSLWVNDTDRTFAFSCVNDSYRLFLGEGAFRPAVRDGYAPYLTRLQDITLNDYSIAGPPTSMIRWKEGNRIRHEIGYIEANIQNQVPGLHIVHVNYCVYTDPNDECQEHWYSGGTFENYRGDGFALAYYNPSICGLCYYNWVNGTLEYFRLHYGPEFHDIIDGGPGAAAGGYCSLAYDNHGNPHISYRDMVNGGLKYAFRNETGWHTMTIDPRRSAGLYTSIAIDSDNEPHISYSDESSLWYASVNGTAWYTQQVDRTPTLWTSIDVDSKNRPRIAYYDSRKKDLKFAWWEPYVRGHPFPR